ncbi:procathepsin L-like [Stegostoma tigrinum]|uniref:procathepsin L-like n=1 Tax=Stegostoma tigrinum TaxID=3053191 RepID=UPI00287052EB|nr:procathepsin L-like [Stegostoma tigrinum]
MIFCYVDHLGACQNSLDGISRVMLVCLPCGTELNDRGQRSRGEIGPPIDLLRFSSIRLSIMKFALFLGFVMVCILAVTSGHTFDSRLDEDWKNWKSQHEKQYTEDEENYKRMVWEDNMRYIEQHNLEYPMGKHTFTVGMNEYGDLMCTKCIIWALLDAEFCGAVTK